MQIPNSIETIPLYIEMVINSMPPTNVLLENVQMTWYTQLTNYTNLTGILSMKNSQVTALCLS